jgi:hypothetical protein
VNQTLKVIGESEANTKKYQTRRREQIEDKNGG